MKTQIAAFILGSSLVAHLCFSEAVTTSKGKTYHDNQIIRIENDGITLKNSTGIFH